MILVWMLMPILGLVQWVVSRLPVADTAALHDRIAAAGRVVAWVLQLNECIPIVEALAVLTLLFGIWSALYGVMLVRRIFSLFWPGAGS